MSTRALIGKVDKHSDSVTAIYLHWDGYPEYVLSRLEGYQTNDDINDLLALGDCSKLTTNITTNVHYSRDKGEQWNVFQFDSIKEFKDTIINEYEYGYLYEDGKWKVIEHK